MRPPPPEKEIPHSRRPFQREPTSDHSGFYTLFIPDRPFVVLSATRFARTSHWQSKQMGFCATEMVMRRNKVTLGCQARCSLAPISAWESSISLYIILNSYQKGFNIEPFGHPKVVARILSFLNIVGAHQKNATCHVKTKTICGSWF